MMLMLRFVGGKCEGAGDDVETACELSLCMNMRLQPEALAAATYYCCDHSDDSQTW